MPGPNPLIKPHLWNVSQTFVPREWHWAWRGLMLALPIWEQGGPLRNVSPYGNAISPLAITGATWGATRHGFGLRTDAANERAEATMPEYLKLPLPITVAVFFTYLGTPSSYALLFGGIYNNTYGSPYSTYELGFSSSGQFLLSWNSAGTYRELASILAAPVAGTSYLLVATISAALIELWVNGVLSVSSGTATSNPNYSATSLLHAGDASGTGGLNSNAVVHTGYLWNRVLRGDEIQILTFDPFGPFRMGRNLVGKVPLGTRFYLPSTGAAAISPAFDAGWEETT